MAQQSSIKWTQLTWNPTTGGDKVSAGCKFCYAEKMSYRLKAMGQEKYKNGFEITVHPESLQAPYKWKKLKTVFVNFSAASDNQPSVEIHILQGERLMAQSGQQADPRQPTGEANQPKNDSEVTDVDFEEVKE